jgi:phosphomannomutase/phosphoglucomutase
MTIVPNSAAFEREPLAHASGFREYDARWLWPNQINARGMMLVGRHLGAMVMARHPNDPRIVVGHDYRAYSADMKHALVVGLMAAGAHVVDIGLATTPMAYFAQFHLNIQSVAMITASHNENGWVGIKMGIDRPLTFGPHEMAELKKNVQTVLATPSPLMMGGHGGGYAYRPDVIAAYTADLTKDVPCTKKWRVVVSCGNGTPALMAADVFRALGCDVIEQNCTLDYTFPNHNPNPEALEMLHAMGASVREHKADLAIGFDGDGDRCGVVDHTGTEIYADILGVLLARDLVRSNPGVKKIIADVKSTGLYAVDTVLGAAGVTTEYWRTGHAYMKRRLFDTGAAAAFEKSGHFFYGPPVGRGYDDGLFSAVQVLRMLDRTPNQTLAGHVASLPKTYVSPTMHRECPDDRKYIVADEMVTLIETMRSNGQTILDLTIADVSTINGVRFTLNDGTWGLVRGSSNKPEIVVVVESPVSAAQMHAMFDFIDQTLTARFAELGAYDQTITQAA